MGIFDIFKNKDSEDKDVYTGETPPCPNCGEPLIKRYVYSEMYCTNCRYGLDDYEDAVEDEERLSVYDAAEIWASNGKDEDYTFGYTESELEDAL